jgi:hypothetical protein
MVGATVPDEIAHSDVSTGDHGIASGHLGITHDAREGGWLQQGSVGGSCRAGHVTVIRSVPGERPRATDEATARAERLTQAVRAKAFRGELVPTEAELARREGRGYEPASALLARIRASRGADGEPARAGRGPRGREGRQLRLGS